MCFKRNANDAVIVTADNKKDEPVSSKPLVPQDEAQDEAPKEETPKEEPKEGTAKEDTPREDTSKEETPDQQQTKPSNEVHVTVLEKSEENLAESNGNFVEEEDQEVPDKDTKKGEGGAITSPTQMRGNLDRYDEFTSYHNRSERSHAFPDREPSKEELALRKVQLKEELTIHKHEGEGITEEELHAYFMQQEDFERCDADVELTSYRWEKHKKGKKSFDDDENTLRGLEDVIQYDQKREHARLKHTKDILTETMKQRAKGKVELDWDKIRHVALKTSEPAQERAHKIGLEDAKDAREGMKASARFGSFVSSSSGSSTEQNRKSVGRMRMMLSFRGNKGKK